MIKENSKSLYTIDKREGYKLIIKDEKRKLKPPELLQATTVSNPISQAYIDRTIRSKENPKTTNKLIRNEDMSHMTKLKALKAKKKIQKMIHYHQHYQLEVMIEY